MSEGGIRPAALGQGHRRPETLKNSSQDYFYPALRDRAFLVLLLFLQRKSIRYRCFFFGGEQKHMRELLTAKANIDHLFGLADVQENKEMER